MVVRAPHLDIGLAQLYARALLAIARADDQIGVEEGQRLQEQIEHRTGVVPSLADLLLVEPLSPSELAAQLRSSTSPFRGSSMHSTELAAMIVVDAITVVLAKGYVAEAEAHELVRFATALGCTLEQVRELSADVAPLLTADYLTSLSTNAT